MFLGTEHLLHDLVWPGEPATTWFATSVSGVAVILAAALLVGLARRATGLTPPDPNFLDELVEGRSEPRHAAQLVGIGLLSLVGGASGAQRRRSRRQVPAWGRPWRQQRQPPLWPQSKSEGERLLIVDSNVCVLDMPGECQAPGVPDPLRRSAVRPRW